MDSDEVVREKNRNRLSHCIIRGCCIITHKKYIDHASAEFLSSQSKPSPQIPSSSLPLQRPHDCANLLLALNFAPNHQSTKIPITPNVLKHASNVTPLSTPRLMNSGLANMILPQASALLKKSFPANRLAAYCG